METAGKTKEENKMTKHSKGFQDGIYPEGETTVRISSEYYWTIAGPNQKNRGHENSRNSINGWNLTMMRQQHKLSKVPFMSRATSLVALIVLLFTLVNSTAAIADEFDFGEENTPAPGRGASKDGKNWFPSEDHTFSVPLKGSLSLNLGKQTGGSKQRWVELGPSLDNIFNWAGAYGTLHIEGSYSYNQAYSEEDDPTEITKKYTNESILREAFYKNSIGPIGFTLGKTIIVWGKGDYLSVVDVLSPKNQTELFFAKPEKARLGQDLVSLDFWFFKNQLSLVYVPIPQFDRRPIYGHPYGQIPDYDENLPNKETEDAESGIRWNFEGSKFSLAAIAGKFHRRSPLIATDLLKGTPTKEFPKYEIAALTSQITLGGILIKGEFAYLNDYSHQGTFSTPTGGKAPRVTQYDTVASLAGIDYNSNSYGNFTLEINNTQIVESLIDDETISSTFGAIGWTKSFFRETLTLSVTHMTMESVEHQLERFSLTYKILDSLTLDTQYTRISIASDKAAYRAIEDFDRADIVLAYHYSAYDKK